VTPEELKRRREEWEKTRTDLEEDKGYVRGEGVVS
jgi:hypothetical protein